MPKVSVIIPNYNHAQFLEKRIETVITQTYNDFDVIILDDCSTDDSRKIIDKFVSHSKISQFVYNNVNTGNPFAQWAKGIELASGKYVWIAESDDWSEPTFLEEMMKLAEVYPDVDMLYCGTNIIFPDKVEVLAPASTQSYIYYEKAELMKSALMNGTELYNGSAVIFKRKPATQFLKELSTFYKHGDYFLWICLSKYSPAIFVNQLLNNFRVVGNSVTRKSIGDLRSFDEQARIFKMLNQEAGILSFKEKLYFFKCWAFRFSGAIKQCDVSCGRFMLNSRFSNMGILGSYFWARFTYFYFVV